MKAVSLFDLAPRFDWKTYDPALDQDRLSKQLVRTFELMRDGHWRTLEDIATITGDPHASVSARLRDLRKPRFGGYGVEKRRRTAASGTFEYRLKLGGGAW
jgi:hypothetical protein